MQKSIRFLILIALMITLPACQTSKEEATPTFPPEATSAPTQAPAVPTSTPTKASPAIEPVALISEVLVGVDGNNDYEFIEFYNAGTQAPVDLNGWALWYLLADGQDEILIHRWNEHTLIPPQGHYLLVREGQDVGTTPDLTFTQSMVPFKGALQLRALDGTVMNSLAWGDGPASWAEGSIQPMMQNGISLERAPGGAAGNSTDSGNNSVDFVANPSPNPQNRASELTPAPEKKLSVTVEAPATTEPGSDFAYVVTVSNQTGGDVSNVVVQLPILRDLEITDTPAGVEVSNTAEFWGMEHIADKYQVLLWRLDALADGENASVSIPLRAPWTYLTAPAANYSAVAGNWPAPAFGGTVLTSIEGGVIPIGTLFDLVGSELSVEGTVTMHTGGLYAGTGNVKFYMEDETGGVQVWVPGGDPDTRAMLGAYVRVQGSLELYRGALELVTDPDHVEIIKQPPEHGPWTPAEVSIEEAKNDMYLQGRLVTVEGLVASANEYTYSYEIDLMDEGGETMTVYVDKQTNINIEAIEPGQHYRITGIDEIYNTEHELYPRIQEDLVQIFPPVLMIDLSAPINVASGDQLEVTLKAINHTLEPLTNVQISALLPTDSVEFVSASEGGELNGDQISWTIPDLPGEGAEASVSYTVKVTETGGYLTLESYQAIADQWTEPVEGEPFFVFLGDTVPIWAIQGRGTRSPYVLDTVKTRGVVTGIFPELGGFWIQETDTDQDPLTSSGLFIYAGETAVDLIAGETVEISGTVRETSQQTQIWIAGLENVTLVSEDGTLPTPVELDPPASEETANAYFEALEGMLVQVSEPAIAVGPTSQYGEYVLVLEKNGVERLWTGDTEHNGWAIMVDDGSDIVHSDRSTLAYPINMGDTVTNLSGPLAYTFGRYKIQPNAIPDIIPGITELPTLQPTGSDEFSIMTWNAENVFDLRDPHPADPPMMSATEYRVAIAKIANTILDAGAPTVVGLQEIENISILEDISAHETLVEFQYIPVLMEGTDSRGIDVGYLIRGDRATLKSFEQYVAPEGLTSRPPLAVQVEIQTDSGPVTVFVVNNHFTSMSAGVEQTEPRRNAQAAWNVEVLNQILAEVPGAHVAILGDLNSFLDSLPIETLREGGLQHVFDLLPEDERYSYVYQGASQTLDHILVTSDLFDLIVRVEVLHVNAEFAPPLPGDESPMRKSDHDPVVVTFSLGPN